MGSREEDAGDRELMARLSAGDREALAPLMERHHRRVYRIAMSYLRRPEDALEVVQEAFVKAFQNAARWDGSAEAGPWLARIAVNLSIDRWRRNRRRLQTFAPMPEGDHAADLGDCGEGPEGVVAGRELREKVAGALARLPERQRAIVLLRHYQDLSLEEIARTLGVSIGTVKSSLHRALARLRQGLAGAAS